MIQTDRQLKCSKNNTSCKPFFSFGVYGEWVMENRGLQNGGLVKDCLLFFVEFFLPGKGDRWRGSAGQSLFSYLYKV